MKYLKSLSFFLFDTEKFFYSLLKIKFIKCIIKLIIIKNKLFYTIIHYNLFKQGLKYFD